MAKIELTDTAIDDLPIPSKGHKIHYDSLVKGFGVRITKNGTAAYILNHYENGVEKRTTIGRVEELDVYLARKEASEILERNAVAEKPLRRTKEGSSPWLSVARSDLEYTSEIYAMEYAERLYPKLIHCKTMQEQLAAMRQAFIEVVEAAS